MKIEVMHDAFDPAGFLSEQAERSVGDARHQGDHGRAPQREIQADGIVYGVCGIH